MRPAQNAGQRRSGARSGSPAARAGEQNLPPPPDRPLRGCTGLTAAQDRTGRQLAHPSAQRVRGGGVTGLRRVVGVSAVVGWPHGGGQAAISFVERRRFSGTREPSRAAGASGRSTTSSPRFSSSRGPPAGGAHARGAGRRYGPRSVARSRLRGGCIRCSDPPCSARRCPATYCIFERGWRPGSSADGTVASTGNSRQRSSDSPARSPAG
jgi:hypothetical protein